MFRKKEYFLFVGLVTIFLLILGACSQNTETAQEVEQPEKTIPTTSEEEENEADDSDEPKYGGTYTMAAASDADTLDPHRGSLPNTHGVAGLVYNKLVTYDTGPHVDFTDYSVVPDLAEEWEISDDGLTYTFHLREAYFHDVPPVNGRQLVAEDVVATMGRIINLPGHQVGLLAAVENIEAKDEKTVVFTLKQPFAPFLNNLANHYMWILPMEATVDGGGIDLESEAIGTGPFILEKWDHNVEKIFVQNPNYYEEGKPYLDKIQYVIMPDQGARIAAFRTGQVGSIGALSPEELESLLNTNPDAVVHERIAPNQLVAGMNQEFEPFEDLKVRKAVSMAIDKQGAIERIFGSGEVSGPVNPSLGDWAIPLEEREALQPYDPEQAKQLLADAGYPDGFDVKILTTDGYGEQVVRMVQWVAEDLKEVGINAEVDMVDLSTFMSDRLLTQQYEMAVMYNHYYQEADDWLSLQLRTGAFMNKWGVNDPKLDEMLDEQRLILDPDERKEKVYDIQRYVLENIVNAIGLLTPYNKTPYQPNIRNLEPHASYGLGFMKDVWLDE